MQLSLQVWLPPIFFVSSIKSFRINLSSSFFPYLTALCGGLAWTCVMNPLSVGMSARLPDYLSLSFILSFSLSRDSSSSMRWVGKLPVMTSAVREGLGGEVPDERCDHEPLTCWEVCKKKKVRCCWEDFCWSSCWCRPWRGATLQDLSPSWRDKARRELSRYALSIFHIPLVIKL